jgi:hypothetical protein
MTALRSGFILPAPPSALDVAKTHPRTFFTAASRASTV